MSKSKHRHPRISFVLFYKYFTLWCDCVHKTEGRGGSKDQIVEQHNLKVAQPLDGPKVAQQVKVCNA